ncbi:hypothetical protein DAPPUDRAFT_266625 [Daphnia pulex]|uniref:Uncharacterized protein n=1 Tax=Daphnia pulex TaxID=6669 RepID=E9HVB0_DAPPU|nr:hypothetical protein DAPPUDRAFT_266625 [Daphnia pulex]|eukprot:EFX64324.1 hypothetical protein DAPPUDRAFT_266625 [Daphnia pulex]
MVPAWLMAYMSVMMALSLKNRTMEKKHDIKLITGKIMMKKLRPLQKLFKGAVGST